MKTDFCIIGGGIAGLSVASQLCNQADIVLLEREQDLAYHTTGRSAALYSDLSADGTALALSKLSHEFLVNPPPGFTEHPLHQNIGCLFTATANDKNLVSTYSEKIDDAQILDIDQMLAMVPILRTGAEHICSGLLEPSAFKIDVAALVAGYRKKIGASNGRIRCGAEVASMTHTANGWVIDLINSETNNETITAHKVINAAGAWGDVVAERAGVKPIGLAPRRRNIITFDGPSNVSVDDWPAVGDIGGAYYFLRESGRLMGSSADEVPSTPCDAQPEEYDIALAAHSIEANTTLTIQRVHHKWAGLRTFAPDRQLVAGYDPEHPDFFWLVGQGGFGIQTAPAAATAAATLALEQPLPSEFEQAEITPSTLSRQRFARA